MAQYAKNTGNIRVICKTKKESMIMLSLIVPIQRIYRKHFAKQKNVNYWKMLEKTHKLLGENGCISYPCNEKCIKFFEIPKSQRVKGFK